MFSFYTLKSTILVPVFGIQLIFLGFLLSTAPVFGDSVAELKEKYEEIEEQLIENTYDIPVYMESNNDENLMSGKVYGIIYHPFNKVSHALSSVTNACEIMPQHLNIKACTYEYKNNKCRLTFYSGRKFYQKADDVQRLNYIFNVTELNDKYFTVTLNTNEEPFDSENSSIAVAAIPLTDSSTFFYLTYKYQYGFFMHLAMSTYLSTFGRNKIGFSIIDTDENNNPIYSGGIRGVIERNVMRYYFAIKSYLDTQSVEKDKRFESRINYWFDLTEKHHKQLYEMDKADYLKFKRREYQDQLRLQEVVNESIKIDKKNKSIPNINGLCVSKG